jgi:hypothetical protein
MSMSAKETKTKEAKTDIYDKINKLYSGANYMSKYGSDVWAAIVICILFLLLTNYYIFANTLEVIRSDWPNQRCSPLIMPFAGFINKPSNETNLEFTVTNFNDCVNTMLKEVVDISVQPLYFAVGILQEAVNGLIDAVNKLRQMTQGLRESFNSIIDQIYAGIANVVVFTLNFFIKMKDSMAKINGILTAALYTLFGSYMAAESLFLCLIELIIIILILVAVGCLLFWGISLVLLATFFGAPLAPPFAIASIIWLLVFIAIMIPCIWFEYMLMKVMDLSSPPMPGIPACFAEDTLIELLVTNNHDSKTSKKRMKDMRIGDILKNGSKVTAVLKCSAKEQNLYKLNNVMVTGEHRVFYPEENKWIKVKNHKNSVFMSGFNEPYVYCLGTDKKEFSIGDTLFSDWDDIDADVLEDLRPHLPYSFNYKDIHIHLDCGFHHSSKIVLENRLSVTIKDVKVNDTLLSGDKVVAIIKIAGHDVSTYHYSFNNDNRTICGTKNIQINDDNLGVINAMDYIKTHQTFCKPLPEEEYMYHLLTDTSFFVVNNIRVGDYNSGIDKYLRK